MAAICSYVTTSGSPTRHRTEREHVAGDVDVERGEELAGQRAGGDARGGLAGAGALEDVAHVVAVVLQRAREIGMSGTRTCHRRRAWRRSASAGASAPTCIVCCQFFQSRLRISMATGCRACGPCARPLRISAVSDLDLHAAAAAVAELPPTKIAARARPDRWEDRPGRPSTIATSACPCDSPAVRKRSINRRFYTRGSGGPRATAVRTSCAALVRPCAEFAAAHRVPRDRAALPAARSGERLAPERGMTRPGRPVPFGALRGGRLARDRDRADGPGDGRACAH